MTRSPEQPTSGVDEKAMRHAATVREQFRVSRFHMTTQRESDRVFLEAYEVFKGKKQPDDCPKCKTAFVAGLASGRPNDYAKLQEELAERDASFDLRWKADMRAIKSWQEATGRTLVWPDHADLSVWLLEQLDATIRESVPLTDKQRESILCSMAGARHNANAFGPEAHSVVVERRENEAMLAAVERQCNIRWKGEE